MNCFQFLVSCKLKLIFKMSTQPLAPSTRITCVNLPFMGVNKACVNVALPKKTRYTTFKIDYCDDVGCSCAVFFLYTFLCLFCTVSFASCLTDQGPVSWLCLPLILMLKITIPRLCANGIFCASLVSIECLVTLSTHAQKQKFAANP